MLLQIEATGPGSDQISYKLGNHPSRQVIRRESESLGRLWFSDYQEEHCNLVFHVRSNVPSIPNRLFSRDLRLREWHRFPEWLDSFLGEILRDPRVPAPEESQPEYRIQLQEFPEPIEYTEELKDFFERADLTFDSEIEPGTELESITLKTEILALSQVLRRLCLLVPAIAGHKIPDRTPRDYARMLDSFCGTWFNVHPYKDYITNRFLWLHESHEQEGKMYQKTFSLPDRVEEFQQRKEFSDSIGNKLNTLLKEGATEKEDIWVLNAGDGYFLESFSSFDESVSLRISDGNQKRLERLDQRLNWLSNDTEQPRSLQDAQVEWIPFGTKHPDIDQPDALIWSPGGTERTMASREELLKRLFDGYAPDHLLIWYPVSEEDETTENPFLAESPFSSPDEFKQIFNARAEQKNYTAQWSKESYDHLDVDCEYILFGLFGKQKQYV